MGACDDVGIKVPVGMTVLPSICTDGANVAFSFARDGTRVSAPTAAGDAEGVIVGRLLLSCPVTFV